MEHLSPSRLIEKSPLKDVTNSTPTPLVGSGSPRKIPRSRSKRSNSTSITPQRRSTRLSSLKSESLLLATVEKAETTQPQSVRSTRSRRKMTPGAGGNGTGRKRSAKKESQDGSVSSGRRTRRSISTVPSSPLAGKSTPPLLPNTPKEQNQTESISANPDENESQFGPMTETIWETSQELTTSLDNYRLTHQNETTEPAQSPIKLSPFSISPSKFNRQSTSLSTPIMVPTPRLPFSCLKAKFDENDIFAISPALFSRKKARQQDYLDIMNDADRTDFVSPVKPISTTLPSPSGLPAAISQLKQVSENVKETLEQMGVDIITDTESQNVNMDQVEEYAHFAFLEYLAELASVRDRLPENQTSEDDELAHGTIEDILTAAALAESVKDEIFMLEDDAVEIEQPADPLEMEVEIHVQEDRLDYECVRTSGEAEIAETTSSELPGLEKSDLAINAITAPALAVGELLEDDLESLISYSEAEIDIDEETLNLQILTGQSFQEISESQLQNEGDKEVPIQELNDFSPRLTVGVDESGNFVHDAEFNIFEDMDEEQDYYNHEKENSRLSIDNSTILSIPGTQEIVTSPPKREISALNEHDNINLKKRKTAPVLPNTTRLDVLRKRATRQRAKKARHNIKRRDFTTALQSVMDNIPSPASKVATLETAPALIPPSLVANRLRSPVTPAPSKRHKKEGQKTPVGKSPSPLKQSSVRKEILSPRKHIAIRATPMKAVTPKSTVEFVFDNGNKDETPIPGFKATPRYEVYSKIFGPPPQLPKQLTDKDATIKLNESASVPVQPEAVRFKSPLKKRKEPEPEERATKKSEGESQSNLGKPMRNETLAIPIIPTPQGPPQLAPSTQRNKPQRVTAVNSVTPSPAQPPPSVTRSGLPRPSAAFGSALPVPATRRSTRVPKSQPAPVAGVQTRRTNGKSTNPPTAPVAVPEKKTLSNGHDGSSVNESVVVSAIPENIQNVTIDRPKGKLGGAQRVNRNGGEPKDAKKVDVPKPIRPTTPPLTSLSQKELKSLTDANTKKNEGFKTVTLQPAVKRINKKRPGEPSDDFQVGKGAKWSKTEALPEWDREYKEATTIQWKSPRFMSKIERKGALRVKSILKKKEQRMDEDVAVSQCEILVVQRFMYKGET